MNTKLQRIDDRQVDLAQEPKELTEAAQAETAGSVQDLQTQLNSCQTEEKTLKSNLKRVEQEKQQLVDKKTRCELDLSEMRERKVTNAQKKKEVAAEIKKVATEVTKVQAQLGDIAPQFQASLSQESETKEGLADAERKLKELYSKQGCGLYYEPPPALYSLHLA